MLQSDTFWALVGLIIFLVIVVSIGLPKRLISALDNRSARIRTDRKSVV